MHQLVGDRSTGSCRYRAVAGTRQRTVTDGVLSGASWTTVKWVPRWGAGFSAVKRRRWARTPLPGTAGIYLSVGYVHPALKIDRTRAPTTAIRASRSAVSVWLAWAVACPGHFR